MYPPHFERAKICKFCPTVGRWYDFELVLFENEAANRKTKTNTFDY